MKKPDNILRLKYRLEPKENDMVEFQILEQDWQLFKNQHCIIGDRKFAGWEIISRSQPMIITGHKELFLRGNLSMTNMAVVKFYGHDLIPSIHKALEEMVRHVYGNCKVVKG